MPLAHRCAARHSCLWHTSCTGSSHRHGLSLADETHPELALPNVSLLHAMQDDSWSHGQVFPGRLSSANASGQSKQPAHQQPRGLRTAANACEGMQSKNGSQVSNKQQVDHTSGTLPLDAVTSHLRQKHNNLIAAHPSHTNHGLRCASALWACEHEWMPFQCMHL